MGKMLRFFPLMVRRERTATMRAAETVFA